MLTLLDHDIDATQAWIGADLPDDIGQITIDAGCIAELHELAATLAANPLPVLSLHADDFELPQCRALMAQVTAQLDQGPGFAIIDRLPLEAFGDEAVIALYWLLASLVARPVAQSWGGKMLYDVRDSGKQPGNGVRPDITAAGQNLHTDNSYNLCQPDYVSLLCRQTSMSGGVSQLVSFTAVHNRLRRDCPDLLARLYQDFTFDRQREHAPNDELVIHHPLFTWDGAQLLGRLSKRMVIQGYKLEGRDMDPAGAAALVALEAAMTAPEMMKEFHFQPGQIQIVNNRTIGHARTAFTDWPEPARKRHLVRLWLRHKGRAFYNG